MTTATDLELLLRAVIRDPDEDTPRLMYADALQESGAGERAEFIRLQYRIEHLMRVGGWSARGRPLPKELIALRTQEATALRSYWGDWCPQAKPKRGYTSAMDLSYLVRVHQYGDGTSCRIAFTRGFVSRVEMPCAAFLGHAAALFAAHPVTEVALTDLEPEDLGYGYCWYNEPLGASPSSVPDELYGDRGGEPDCMRWVRANPKDCLTALGVRAVAYGRSLVPWLSGGAS